MQKKLIVIVILFIIAVGLVGFIFIKRATINPPPAELDGPQEEEVQEEITYPDITPRQRAEEFYQWYLDGHTLPATDYQQSPLLTDNLKQDISEKLNASQNQPYDLFLCAKDVPDSYYFEKDEITGTSAVVVLREEFGDTEGTTALLSLILENGEWKIDNVSCFIKG